MSPKVLHHESDLAAALALAGPAPPEPSFDERVAAARALAEAEWYAMIREQAADVIRRRQFGQDGGAYVLGPREVVVPPVGSPEAEAFVAEPITVDRLLVRRRPDGTMEIVGVAPVDEQKEGGA